ncbi:hypothetical protein GC093_16910 [Paenibacillus sp. LMG 31456]|uniref:Uncharacterized protein n=1 Tax=Paenibacillus foliorum TaxID=2654974 RepID=A0A972GUS8_9BACL|nr:hypothetical protein [Paenibacillus foliorum]NOU94889.1 hypothetical protein [Paenibacillus foliorum]
MKTVYQNLFQLISSIELTLEKKFITPSLVLLYSGIDIVASLNTEIGRDVQRSDFINWVNKYMIPHINIPLTGDDIYSARCAVVHSMRSESKMSRQGKAIQIFYTWGDKESEELQNLINLTNMKHIAIKFETLFQAFRLGIVDFFEEAETDTQILHNIFNRAQSMLSYSELPKFENFE